MNVESLKIFPQLWMLNDLKTWSNVSALYFLFNFDVKIILDKGCIFVSGLCGAEHRDGAH